MLKFYVSCRPLRYSNELITPREQFAHGFKGLDVEAHCIVMNLEVDGRMLYEVSIGNNSEYSEEQCNEYKDIILEGLQLFSVHEKTLESANNLALIISGKQFDIVGDSLIPPPREE